MGNAKISQLVDVLLNNQKINEAISEKYNIKLLNILQPVPIYIDSYSTSKVPKEFLPTEDKSFIKNVKLGYQIYLSKSENMSLNLSKLKIKKPMYIDSVHYSSEFNKTIADTIINKIGLKSAN